MSAAIYNCFLGIGYLVAPLYGTSVAELLGFRLTMDILAFFDLAFAIAYFSLAGGIGAFKSLCQKKKINGQVSHCQWANKSGILAF